LSKLKHKNAENAKPKHHYTTPQPFYGPFFRDYLGEPVPEENFLTLCCKED